MFPAMLRQLAAGVGMHPDLEVELLEMNMVLTCEYSIEAVHAMIKWENRGGQPLKPETVAGRLTYKNAHVHALRADWQFRMFVLNFWSRPRDPAAKILRGVVSPEFLKRASKQERIRAVYFSLPEQWFAGAKVEGALAEKLRAVTKPKAVVLPPLVRLAVDMVKERLQRGSVISLPASLVPMSLRDPGLEEDGARGAMVPAEDGARGAIVPAWQPCALLTDASALAVSAPADGYAVRLGAAFADHVFFQVLKTDLQRRAVQSDSGRRAVGVSVLKLRLKDRIDDAGVFEVRSSSVAVGVLDLLSLLNELGFAETIGKMVLWGGGNDAFLDVTCPGIAALQGGAALLPVGQAELDRQQAVARTSHRSLV